MSKKYSDQPKVYSYIRFSTPDQALGDSERRQIAGAQGFAKRHDLVLDDTLSLTDRGLSGFHGTHRKKGALGKFLIAVEAGRVPAGSILLVENIDRLSREGAYTIIRQIVGSLWEHQISLATLYPEELYEPFCDNDAKFLALFLFMQRAQDESARKSERIRHARDQARIKAREDGKLLTSRIPAWLDAEHARATGECVAIPEAVETIQRIFQLKQEGLGASRIEQKLNDDPNVWKRKNGWRTSYIKKILTNRAVIGEYQPHRRISGRREPEGDPIQGYYPTIVDPKLFHSVQATLRKNKHKGGRTGKVKNLLTHLAKCAYCGGSMVYADKGETWQYLVCDNGRRGHSCKRHSVRYDETIDVVLANCAKLDPGSVLPNPDQQTKECDAIRKRLNGAESQIADVESQITNFIDQIGRSKSAAVAARCETRVEELELQKRELQSRMQEDVLALRNAERSLQSFKHWKRDLKELMAAVQDDDAVELRAKLRTHLQQFITKVEVFAVGYPTLDNGSTREKGVIQSSDDIRETLEGIALDNFPEALDDKQFHAFVEHVAKLRMTKDGRFVRVHFTSGSVLDFVPKGSFASGMELVTRGKKKRGWRFVSPDLNECWKGFCL